MSMGGQEETGEGTGDSWVSMGGQEETAEGT